MTRKDAYQLIVDNLEVRPLNKYGQPDGSYNYVHRIRVIQIVDRIFDSFEEEESDNANS